MYLSAAFAAGPRSDAQTSRPLLPRLLTRSPLVPEELNAAVIVSALDVVLDETPARADRFVSCHDVSV